MADSEERPHGAGEIDRAISEVSKRREFELYGWKMVRRIVGVLAAIGQGELREDAVAFLQTDKPVRGLTPAALTAPAAGLQTPNFKRQTPKTLAFGVWR